MADRAAQDAAQHISAALIRRQDAVHDHDGHRTRMVGDNLERNILLRILAVFHTGNLGGILDDGIKEIRLEVRALVLHDRGKALQTAARIDVFMGERLVLPVLRAVVLREHEVPDLKIAVAVAADTASR